MIFLNLIPSNTFQIIYPIAFLIQFFWNHPALQKYQTIFFLSTWTKLLAMMTFLLIFSKLPQLSSHLTYNVFFEFSFLNGVFSENCSLAKIIPLYKKVNKTNPSNYRPISKLTWFSKIFERLKYVSFLEFFKKHNVIHNSQYGLQKHIATNHACLDIVTTTLENMNQRKYTGLIFLDLQKAFDTVSPKILLKKLDHYDIREPTHKLICCFLHRKQYVSVDGIQSEIESITYGMA